MKELDAVRASLQTILPRNPSPLGISCIYLGHPRVLAPHSPCHLHKATSVSTLSCPPSSSSRPHNILPRSYLFYVLFRVALACFTICAPQRDCQGGKKGQDEALHRHMVRSKLGRRRTVFQRTMGGIQNAEQGRSAKRGRRRPSCCVGN